MTEHAENTWIERNPWKWVLAFMLAVASHGVWLFWLDTTWAVPRDAPPAAPPWTLATLSEDGTDQSLANVLHVWSPAAFALPTSRGFSRALITEEISLRPPLHSPSEPALSLDRDRLRPAAVEAIFLPGWEQMRVKLDAQPLPLTTPVRADPVGAPILPPVPQVAYVDGVEERRAEHMALTEDVHLWGHTAWTAELTLYMDPWGVVRRVIVDQRAPDEQVMAHLVREVSAWRWTPAERSDTARVRIVYYGARKADAPQEGP